MIVADFWQFVPETDWKCLWELVGRAGVNAAFEAQTTFTRHFLNPQQNPCYPSLCRCQTM